MPTTQPLDQLSDTVGGPALKPIPRPKHPVTPTGPAAPVPKAAPAPTPAPKPQAPKPDAPGPTAGLGLGPSMSLKGKKTSGNPGQQHHPAHPAQARNTPFTADQLKQAWQKYIDANTARHLLVTAMRATSPIQQDGTTALTLSADSPINLQLLHDALPALTRYLRDTLLNDTIALQAVLRDGPESPLAWNDRQLMQHMLEAHPQLEAFMHTLSLKLD